MTERVWVNEARGWWIERTSGGFGVLKSNETHLKPNLIRPVLGESEHD